MADYYHTFRGFKFADPDTPILSVDSYPSLWSPPYDTMVAQMRIIKIPPGNTYVDLDGDLRSTLLPTKVIQKVTYTGPDAARHLKTMKVDHLGSKGLLEGDYFAGGAGSNATARLERARAEPGNTYARLGAGGLGVIVAVYEFFLFTETI